MRSVVVVFLLILAVFAAVVVVSLVGEKKGIIVLEGYSHGVIICGEGMTINSGHYEDDEVGELIRLAKEECPK